MSFFKSTGDSAEDRMSRAAGCFILALLVIYVMGIGAVVEIFRFFAR